MCSVPVNTRLKVAFNLNVSFVGKNFSLFSTMCMSMQGQKKRIFKVQIFSTHIISDKMRIQTSIFFWNHNFQGHITEKIFLRNLCSIFLS